VTGRRWPTLSLRQYEALLAVSLGARPRAPSEHVAEIIALGLATNVDGFAVTTPEGEAYLRETTERAIRGSGVCLKRSNGTESA
jgi:hypothetical protein